ncbi:LPXTG cell wall anchor domain-containing protein [Sphingobacterium prati]
MNILTVLIIVLSFLILQASKEMEALNTGNSNEWYTEPGIWLFIFIFIFVITLVIYRKLTKKNLP